MRVYKVDLYVAREFWPALATRCLVGSCAMSLGFYAMQQMVLADASVLLFTSPVMTFFLVRSFRFVADCVRKQTHLVAYSIGSAVVARAH